MSYEAYIVVIGRREGKRHVERKPLNVPVDLATGHYEDLSELQIREFQNDLIAEQLRREEDNVRHAEIAKACGGYDPFSSQVLG